MAQELSSGVPVTLGEDGADEARLLREAQARPEAFAPLYARYFPRVYAYCLRRVGGPEDAEDLTSAVFSRALTGLGGYRGGSVPAWLFTIAHNAVANHLRGRRPHLSLETTMLTGPDAATARGEDTVERLVRAEEHARLARLIAELPEEQREILSLKVAGRLTAKEIGAVLGKREGAVRVALFRIVQRLRAANARAEAEGSP
jgi:RNA polymerase sigma-70 factor (ECF subfamily)